MGTRWKETPTEKCPRAKRGVGHEDLDEEPELLSHRRQAKLYGVKDN